MKEIVYLMESLHNEHGIVYKIGYTKRTSEKRLKEFKTGNRDIELISEYKSEYAKQIETALHNSFSDKRVGGEWFTLSEDDTLNFINRCSLLHNNFSLLDQSTNPFI